MLTPSKRTFAVGTATCALLTAALLANAGEAAAAPAARHATSSAPATTNDGTPTDTGTAITEYDGGYAENVPAPTPDPAKDEVLGRV